MSLYECTFIARQDISSQEVERLADEFTTVVVDGGGKLVKKEYWGLRNLAYRINKNKKGHYMMLGLDAPSAAMRELERRLHLNENIIRNLTVRVEAISADPSPILAASSNQAGAE